MLTWLLYRYWHILSRAENWYRVLYIFVAFLTPEFFFVFVNIFPLGEQMCAMYRLETNVSKCPSLACTHSTGTIHSAWARDVLVSIRYKWEKLAKLLLNWFAKLVLNGFAKLQLNRPWSWQLYWTLWFILSSFGEMLTSYLSNGGITQLFIFFIISIIIFLFSFIR